MPYLQLDIPNRYPVDVKRDLARRFGDTFAHIMQTTPDLVTVAFRELGEGGVWWCGAAGPEPAALLSCDIRPGRPLEQRAELAQALIDACVETLAYAPTVLSWSSRNTRATRCTVTNVVGVWSGLQRRQWHPSPYQRKPMPESSPRKSPPV